MKRFLVVAMMALPLGACWETFAQVGIGYAHGIIDLIKDRSKDVPKEETKAADNSQPARR